MSCLCHYQVRTLTIVSTGIMIMQKDNIFNTYIGIDVSKDKLDIFNSSTGEFSQIKNDKKAIKEFISTFEFSKQTLVIIDLTGGYEAVCVNEFCFAGFNVTRAEGRLVKSFAKASRQLAKTDKIDAKLLADYGCKMHEQLDLYIPFENKLKPYIMRLSDMKDVLQREKNRLKAPNQDAFVLKCIKRTIGHFAKEIMLFEKSLKNLISTDNELHKKYNILLSQKGVGVKSAYILLGLLPELGHINRRKIAAIAGVAPYAKDSGTLSGYRFTKGGRKDVKKALFMCALVAVRYDPKMKAFYDNLVQNGKKKMVANTAAMRKLVIILNAKCKELY